MIDRYLGGGISGRSPEAEVPIFSKISESNHPGGAANVALNLKELGAEVDLIGLVGDDSNGRLLLHLIDQTDNIKGHILIDPTRITTLKTRIISEGNHLLRVDSEDTHDVEKVVVDSFKKLFMDTIYPDPHDGIIIQDYNKGLLTPEIIRYIIDTSNGYDIPVFVDPKFNNFFEYVGVKLFKPNKKEVEVALSKSLTTSNLIDGDYLEKIKNKITCEVLICTLSEDGLIYIHEDMKKHVKAFPREVADVCGAGDTVIATLAMGYLNGYSMDTLSLLANIAGGQVCEQTGVIAINRHSLQEEFLKRKKALKLT